MPTNAIESLAAVGLHVFRTARRGAACGTSSLAEQRRAVAELAIDAVTFHLDGGHVRHHELEIEVKAPGGEDAVVILAESLVARFGPNLRRWRLGKLSTGRAVATLIDERGRAHVLSDDGSLRPSTYDEIVERLSAVTRTDPRAP